MIGLGGLFYGLYRLRLASPTPSSQTFSASTLASTCSLNYHIPSNVIWHFRLEHFSNQRLSQMHHLYHNIHVDNKSICDICHFPKQKKTTLFFEYFYSSIASSKYELLHFDIWVP
jgi:hypothetical protein